jgi:hypothetical protein
MHGESAWRRFAPWIWGALLATLMFAPALAKWDKSGWGDWQYFHHQWEVGRVSFLRWHELPLWDPHHCGGVPLWGQPQSQLYSPLYWITALPFGSLVGHKLFIILHGAIGFVGMFVLCRRTYRFAAPAAALAAVAFAFSGFFAWRGAGGHAPFLAFHFVPWILYFWRRSHDDLRYAAGVALFMALSLFEGGTYPFPFTFLVLAFDTIAILLSRPSIVLRVVRTGAVAGSLTALIGAARLWPIYSVMQRFPRATEVDDTVSVAHVLESLTARDPHAWVWGGHRWVWAEYSAFIGWGVVALAAYGVILAFARRRTWHLPLGAALFAACGMGGIEDHWPWPLLHELPMFDNMHVPSRFYVLLTFYLTPLAGLALHRAIVWVSRASVAPGTMRALAVLGWVLVFGVAVEVVSNSVRVAARWDGPILEHPQQREFHLVGPAGYLERYSQYPSQHIGTMACYDPIPWVVSHGLWAGETPQVRFQPAGAGRVISFTRTNHRFRAHIAMSAPGRAIINQNYDIEWRLSEGTPIDDQGRLAVDLPAGDRTLEGTYEPADLPWSALLTLLGLILAVLLAWKGRTRPALAKIPIDAE